MGRNDDWGSVRGQSGRYHHLNSLPSGLRCMGPEPPWAIPLKSEQLQLSSPPPSGPGDPGLLQPLGSISSPANRWWAMRNPLQVGTSRGVWR